MICFCVIRSFAADELTPLSPVPQGPGYVLPKTSAERAEQQRFLNESYANQQAQQESKVISQQAEMLKILSKDPWRRINNTTNYVGGEGWLQFQGKVQSIESVGILFQGSFGKVLSISTEFDTSSMVLTHSELSDQSATAKSNAASRQATSKYSGVTKTQRVREKIYGDDYFLVINFPYPIQEGKGYERLMAFDSGYITYTNSENRVLTVHKLNYGTPCSKIWSPAEIEAAYKQAEADRAAAEAEKRAQRELITAQAEARQAAIEAERKAELEAIEAEKKAKKLKVFKFYETKALEGDSIALHRLGEFYRDGYGVEVDLAKSEECFRKEKEAAEIEDKRLKEENQAKELARQKQKFDWYVEQAKKGGVSGMIGAGNCYRYGLGVEKNLDKAREYYKAASNAGSSEGAKLFLELHE